MFVRSRYTESEKENPSTSNVGERWQLIGSNSIDRLFCLCQLLYDPSDKHLSFNWQNVLSIRQTDLLLISANSSWHSLDDISTGAEVNWCWRLISIYRLHFCGHEHILWINFTCFFRSLFSLLYSVCNRTMKIVRIANVMRTTQAQTWTDWSESIWLSDRRRDWLRHLNDCRYRTSFTYVMDSFADSQFA